jgi:ankyrin repeat protein
MKLPSQQIILNDLLQNYAIVYLSADSDYTDYLLKAGALPKAPDKFGWLPVASALWTVNDYGDCETPRLLINASNPKILALQNKKGETALMQIIDKGNPCHDELKLLAQKSDGLNLVDHHGNTALHYLLKQMNKNMDAFNGHGDVFPSNLEVLRILLERRASTKISNKKSKTPAQLLHELKRKGCKCY